MDLVITTRHLVMYCLFSNKAVDFISFGYISTGFFFPICRSGDVYHGNTIATTKFEVKIKIGNFIAVYDTAITALVYV